MRTIRFRGTNLKFPAGCAVCLNGAHQTFDFERVFIFNRRPKLLKLAVPLCSDHMRQAKKRSTAQVWCRKIAWAGSAIFSLAAAVFIFIYWLGTPQGQLCWTIP